MRPVQSILVDEIVVRWYEVVYLFDGESTFVRMSEYVVYGRFMGESDV